MKIGDEFKHISSEKKYILVSMYLTEHQQIKEVKLWSLTDDTSLFGTCVYLSGRNFREGYHPTNKNFAVSSIPKDAICVEGRYFSKFGTGAFAEVLGLG